MILIFEIFFQLEIIDACVTYIEALQTQLNVVNHNRESHDEDFEDDVDEHDEPADEANNNGERGQKWSSSKSVKY